MTEDEIKKTLTFIEESKVNTKDDLMEVNLKYMGENKWIKI